MYHKYVSSTKLTYILRCQLHLKLKMYTVERGCILAVIIILPLSFRRANLSLCDVHKYDTCFQVIIYILDVKFIVEIRSTKLF